MSVVPRMPRALRRTRIGERRGGPLTYLILVLSTVLAVFPLYWTVVAASRTNSEIVQTPPPLTPGGNLFSNISEALDRVDMFKALLNSLIVSGAIALGTVFFCTLAGFAFAKLRFRGSTVLLVVILATMMVPAQLGVVPLFILIADLGWVNQLQAVILPTLVSAFGVVFMRQYLSRALPTEIIEAAVVDGASSFRIFRSIVLPAARPAMAVLGMLTFLMAWNDFFWPIIALSSQNPTVQVALNSLGQGYVPDRSIILAGTLVGTVPVLVVFALLGKQIVGGIMEGAVKG
jgi:cellobiose transport system permease protein